MNTPENLEYSKNGYSEILRKFIRIVFLSTGVVVVPPPPLKNEKLNYYAYDIKINYTYGSYIGLSG